MWRSSDDDDGSAAAGRLARVVGLPPDPAGSAFDVFDSPAVAPGTSGSVDGGSRAPELVSRGSALAAFDPGRRGVRVLAVVAGLVVCIAAFLAWRARPQVTPAPPVAATSQLPAATSATALLIVSVTGKVHKPGLVRLPPGARVADAVDAAGGALPGTDLTNVNLARKVVDGELIAIGVPQPPGAAPAGGTGSGGGSGGGPVNLNTATVAELQTLPGIGEVLAQRIIDYREQHGGFRAVTDLRQVEGIGDAKFQQLKDRVAV